ncbi:MAG TPA: chalcone isomerase family protein [Casimicrobiaceae bacterium]
MSPLLRLAGIAVLALFAAGGARAAEVGGVKLDDKVSVGGRELTLNGAGIRTKVFLRIYVVSLYLPQPAKDVAAVFAKAPRRIQMNMLRTLSADQVVEALLDTMRDNNTPAELAAVKAQTDRLASLIRAFKEVKEKDIITLDFVDGGTQLGWNAKSYGTMPGEPFNQALTKIWLGNKPVQADLKKILLGG